MSASTYLLLIATAVTIDNAFSRQCGARLVYYGGSCQACRPPIGRWVGGRCSLLSSSSSLSGIGGASSTASGDAASSAGTISYGGTRNRAAAIGNGGVGVGTAGLGAGSGSLLTGAGLNTASGVSRFGTSSASSGRAGASGTSRGGGRGGYIIGGGAGGIAEAPAVPVVGTPVVVGGGGGEDIVDVAPSGPAIIAPSVRRRRILVPTAAVPAKQII